MFARPRMLALWYPLVLQTDKHDVLIGNTSFDLSHFSKRNRTNFSLDLRQFLVDDI